MKTKIIVGVLTVIAWAVYYYFTQYQPDILAQVAKFALGAFGVSQAIWMVIEWYLPKEETALPKGPTM